MTSSDTTNPEFKGSDYEESEDYERLKRQIDRVGTTMQDGAWRTLGEISAITGDPEASISRQLRYLREERNGGWDVQKRVRGSREGGLWEYRIVKPTRYKQTTAHNSVPKQKPRLTKTNAAEWLADLMDLVDKANAAGVSIGNGVYCLEQ